MTIRVNQRKRTNTSCALTLTAPVSNTSHLFQISNMHLFLICLDQKLNFFPKGMESMIYGLNGHDAQNPVQQMSTLGMKLTEEQDQELLCGRIQRTGGIFAKNGMENG